MFTHQVPATRIKEKEKEEEGKNEECEEVLWKVMFH